MSVVGDDGLAGRQSLEIGRVKSGLELNTGAVPVKAELIEIDTANGQTCCGVTPETHAFDPHQPCSRLGDELQGLLQILSVEHLALGQRGQGRLLFEQAFASGTAVR